ncbi:hypothetical protein GCM10009759_39300 [Kitasatospora saccharophila]|uniref:DUF4365 domain-containing protein n=1 Tax=Kitasatospora saccharophila TaxID=407973 RepID=A0ABN2X3T9_9ACTN
MASIPPNRRIELAGTNAFQTLLQAHDHVVHLIDGGSDLGEDFHIAFARRLQRTGLMAAVQVKTAESPRSKYRLARDYRIPVGTHADDWRNHMLPVIGIVYDMENRKLFWVNLTEALHAAPTTPRWVRVPRENELRAETLDRFIAEIAAYAEARKTSAEHTQPAPQERPTGNPKRSNHLRKLWQVQLPIKEAFHPARSTDWVVVWNPPYLRVIEAGKGVLQRTALKPPAGQRPVVGDSAVYLPAAGGRLRAFGLPDFKMRWEVPLRGNQELARFLDGTLYLPGETEGLHALAPGDGHPRWSTVLADHQVIAPVSLLGDKVIALGGPATTRGTDRTYSKGRVLAIAPGSGEVRWSHAPRNPLLPLLGGNEHVLYLVEQTAASQQVLVAVDLATGEERYRRKLSEPLACSPVASATAVHLMGSDGMIRTRDAVTGRPRWQHPTKQAVLIEPVSAGNSVLVVSERRLLVSLDAATGRQRWECSAPGTSPPRPSWWGIPCTWATAPGACSPWRCRGANRSVRYRAEPGRRARGAARWS